MSVENAEKCKNVLKNAVVESNKFGLQFEKLKMTKYNFNTGIDSIDEKEIKLKGLIDIESESTIWEIKCVQNLTDEHFIQLGIYAWLCRQNNEEKEFYKLLNVLNGEIWEISKNNLKEMIDILLSYYFRKVEDEDDEKFILNALNLVNR